eukprot:5937639-Amphidinium_carterae.1
MHCNPRQLSHVVLDHDNDDFCVQRAGGLFWAPLQKQQQNQATAATSATTTTTTNNKQQQPPTNNNRCQCTRVALASHGMMYLCIWVPRGPKDRSEVKGFSVAEVLSWTAKPFKQPIRT